jgi:hypothetical protein
MEEAGYGIISRLQNNSTTHIKQIC